MSHLLLLLILVIARSCQPNCNDCSSSFCTACANQYQLTTDAQCFLSNTQGCSLYGTSGSCLKCHPTYQLLNSTCQKQYEGCIEWSIDLECTLCAQGKILINASCVGVLNCLSEGSNCSQCVEGFNLKGGICIDESEGCMMADELSGVCMMCNPGYQLEGYSCLDQNNLIPNCVLYSPIGCYICKTGYILNSQSKCVIPGNTICLHFDTSNNCISCSNQYLSLVNGSCMDINCRVGTAGNCLTCNDGYEVKTGICSFVDANCLNSSADAVNRCLNCRQGYFVNANGICLQLPINCRAANIISHVCLQCNPPFVLTAQGTCRGPLQIANCQKTNQLKRTCDLCNPNYYVFGNTCAKVSALCSGYDPKTGSCVNCKSGYSNFGGKCVDQNCQNSLGDNCAQCKPNFATDPLTGLCRFADPNCVSLSFLSCNTCKQGYYLNPIKCVAYPPFCLKIGANLACSQCRGGWSLVEGQCVVAVANCKKYSYNNSISVCSACVDGYDLVSSLCTYNFTPLRDPNCLRFSNSACLECSNRFYFLNSKCTPVNPNCKSYTPNGNCTDCYAGYKVSGGSCIINAANDNNCNIFSNGTCSSCYAGFFLNMTSKNCQAINPLCKTSNLTTGGCTQCFAGYTLAGNSCTTASKNPNCINFDNTGRCLTCSSRFFLKAGICTPISPLCKTFNMTTGNCLSCYPGYYLSGGACLTGAEPNSNINCKLRDSSGRCLQCYESYFLASNSSCILANPLCKTLNLTTGACLSCYPGYTISGADCVLSTGSNSDPNCITYSNGGCRQCYTGFYISGGVCSKINMQCLTYNPSNGWCLSCYPGYEVNSKGLCVIPSSFSSSIQDPYCLQRSGSACTQCSTGYFSLRGVCQIINPLCRNIDYSSGDCTTCYTGYVVASGDCVVYQEVAIPFCQTISGGFCRKCIQGYFTENPLQCSPVSILCSTYDQNTGSCLSCIAGYFLQGGGCVYPSMGFDQNCMDYDASAYCTSCRPGYYLLNYVCSKINPYCVDFDFSSLTCTECGGGKIPSGAQCQ